MGAILILAAVLAYAKYGERWQQTRWQSALPEAQTYEQVIEPETVAEEAIAFVLPLERETEMDIASDPSVVITSEPSPVITSDPSSVIASDSEAILASNTPRDRVNLAVPFTSQAPHANWSLPYQEACEEASVLMAVDFFDDALVDLSTADAADAAILDLVAFQTERLGKYEDTTAAQTAQFASQKFEHIGFSLLEQPSVEDLQSELSKGNLVIVPAYGRVLGNPNFTGDGPLYHMLVMRGFDAQRGIFITNDPGTRNGRAYVYREEVLMNAMGDWNDGDPQNGEKVVIVVSSRIR